ncbi:hypothetical protein ACIRP0_23360 [Streptomyces sp. NPDC101733]|uniref:hypothetical protein n=1 Tax=unclassified Streptomyces TaxID=2593676 RepID=UPI00382EB85F
MRTHSRSCRIAVVTVGTVVALAASAVSSFADARPSTAGTTGHARAAVQLLPAGDKTGDSEPVIPDTFQPPVAGGWQSKGVINLGGGWTAGVDVNASARTARADIARHGAIKHHLEAYGKNARVRIGDATFTLTPEGMITKTGSAPAPAPVPGGWQSKGITSLGGGWTARVSVNVSARTARAEVARGYTFKGRLEAYAKDARIEIDGRIFTLTPTGTISKADSAPAPAPVAGGWHSKGVSHLGAGWTAVVSVNASARTARADIARGGVVEGHLEAYGKSTSVKIGNRAFTLTPTGTLRAREAVPADRALDAAALGAADR